VINHKKGKERQERGFTSQKKSLLNSGKSLFIPQGNFRIKGKGINTPLSTVHLMWVTAKRLKRKGRSLGCHPCDYFSLTSRTHLIVPHKQLQQLEPSLYIKSDQAGTRIKYLSHKKILDKRQRYKSPATSCSFEVDDS
jgi:hypothetical protein